ncbi:ABC transporter permease subunit [Bacillus suaedaesalsae]|uniref:ABC transporter permease subunit n=1 Tax=Bacillus suaedaesalsae TaxID=2810349 RepID=A0ABS2DGG8_9BACI|nr:ABC transporter permease subunit [Bacillus suaedaesalsae]MBM6617569.1 ABC transporter permease subunit [Bacillus suaedaesalsae]
MNLHLLKAMYKTNGKIIGGIAVTSFLYLWLIIWLYPTIADSQAMDELLKSMPPEMMSAFGLSQGFGSIEAFIAGEYYGLLYIIICLVYVVLVSTALVARLNDHGSMAYLLATGVTRSQVIITQMVVLVSGLFLIALLTYLSGISGTRFIIEDVSINSSHFLKLNVVGFLLFFAVSSYSFLITCIVSDEKKALGISAGITLLFFIFNLVGKMSEDIDWLRNLSIFSLFEPQEIATGNQEILGISLMLFLIGAIFYSFSIIIFRNRDLPL